MKDEIKEILEYVLSLTYGNENAIKGINKVKDYITNLQEKNELHNKILKDANDVLNVQAQGGNYNYDSYMLGLYNGMEMIVSLFEQREPKFKCGKDIKFLHEIDYKSRNEKAIENIDLVIELIKQQPTGDDTWILNKLNGFKYLLQGEDK